MIKGVNKKVLEINNPQSLYFEKAVLYLKPNMTNISHKLLRAEAQEMIWNLSPKPQKNVFLKVGLISFFSAIALLGATFGVYCLFTK